MGYERTVPPSRRGPQPHSMSFVPRASGLVNATRGPIGAEVGAEVGAEIGAEVGAEIGAEVGAEGH